MSEFDFFTDQEIDDGLDKPYLITIHLVNGQQFILGRDTEREASATTDLICDLLIDGSELLYSDYVIIKLDSVASITFTHQN